MQCHVHLSTGAHAVNLLMEGQFSKSVSYSIFIATKKEMAKAWPQTIGHLSVS